MRSAEREQLSNSLYTYGTNSEATRRAHRLIFGEVVANGAFTRESLATHWCSVAIRTRWRFVLRLLYNEVAFWALGKVNPVTHAAGNTINCYLGD